jgi:hypothetical protein
MKAKRELGTENFELAHSFHIQKTYFILGDILYNIYEKHRIGPDLPGRF